MARDRRPGRLRLRHGQRRAHAPVSRPAARRDDAADGTDDARQRLRRVGRKRRRHASRSPRSATHPTCCIRTARGGSIIFKPTRGRAGAGDSPKTRTLTQELFIARGMPRVVMRWRLSGKLSDGDVCSCGPCSPGATTTRFIRRIRRSTSRRSPATARDTIEWQPYERRARHSQSIERHVHRGARLVSAVPLSRRARARAR